MWRFNSKLICLLFLCGQSVANFGRKQGSAVVLHDVSANVEQGHKSNTTEPTVEKLRAQHTVIGYAPDEVPRFVIAKLERLKQGAVEGTHLTVAFSAKVAEQERCQNARLDGITTWSSWHEMFDHVLVPHISRREDRGKYIESVLQKLEVPKHKWDYIEAFDWKDWGSSRMRQRLEKTFKLKTADRILDPDRFMHEVNMDY
jgi:hypothetical protein